MQCFEFLRPSYWSYLTFFFVVNLWDEKAKVYKVKQITQLCQRIKKKKHSFLPKLHHSATRYGYFVLILVFLLWFCLKSYFFHRLQIFLFENQPFPLKFVDQLVLSSIFTISLNHNSLQSQSKKLRVTSKPNKVDTYSNFNFKSRN